MVATTTQELEQDLKCRGARQLHRVHRVQHDLHAFDGIPSNVHFAISPFLVWAAGQGDDGDDGGDAALTCGKTGTLLSIFSCFRTYAWCVKDGGRA
jgi:hypothetical protein